MAKILVVDDENEINELIKKALEMEQYNCESAYSGTEALMKIKSTNYDLVILDLMLPGMNGEDVLKQAHEISNVPVIVLSAKDELDTKVSLLTLGADDYLTKPFEVKELVARVFVALRKNKKDNRKSYQFKDLHMDINQHEVKIKDQVLNLTQQEFKILELLLMHPDIVFSKQEIYEYAWDDQYIGEDKTINVHISNIRQKIKKITDLEYIETIWGIGFRMNKEESL